MIIKVKEKISHNNEGERRLQMIIKVKEKITHNNDGQGDY